MPRNSKKVFVTGSSGLLGKAVIGYFRNFYDVHTTYYKNYFPLDGCNLAKIDLRNKSTINLLLKKINPSLIIHTAALTDVDYCETHKEETYASNVLAAKYIAEESAKLNSKLIHISTNFLFDGKKALYKEEDSPSPVNYYSRTKAEAEKAVEKSKADYIIIRSAIFGWNIQNKKSFPETVIHNLRNNLPVKAYTDQYFSPILVNHLARILDSLYKKDAKGIFHVGTDQRISRYEFALKIADVFSLDKTLIHPINLAEFRQKIKRPDDTSLDNSKLKSFLGINKMPIEKDIEEMKKLQQAL